MLRTLTLPTTFAFTSKAEILEQLPKLNPVELREIRDRIWQLEEEELLSGRAQPSDAEKALLDREFEDFARDPASGSSWRKSNLASRSQGAVEWRRAISPRASTRGLKVWQWLGHGRGNRRTDGGRG